MSKLKNVSFIENFNDEYKNSFFFSHQIKIRFSETDMFGHMNNTAPFTYFEEGRIEFFKNNGLMQKWLDPKGETIPVVADLQCEYLHQTYFDEKITLNVKINRVGTSSVDLHYLGINELGESLFAGRGAIVQINKHTGKSVPWTEREKEMLSGA
ncbi:acyl-CoA thioesterase [Metabacillus halosaccharovorans]|uniref:Acyl-CoA thioesterase n=1 Tax=Metabacillus halosaccharovorans TaxID=930124 RepID=A0ABT3DE10_9BACI|nr:thioesterase family protein [Metabacillus halosaccharovorans]MCV9885182.1 acyl-CoA thioesterase [Metabacillus halosaccharovorans]